MLDIRSGMVVLPLVLMIATCSTYPVRPPRTALSDARLDAIQAGLPASEGDWNALIPGLTLGGSTVYDVAGRLPPTSSSCGGPLCTKSAFLARSGPLSLQQTFESADTSVTQTQTLPPNAIAPRVAAGQAWWARQQAWQLGRR